ncbi:MAG: hypothetical protein A2Y03_04870 [Omnitrophica WOR_2 bacterium GWF2_38_59]|nr:MAG: hypothetical protein A2Y03_04870 [Omnitrophica WOR_2 bacterium GWF2_38_59]OGX48284.1 MAG: hypothetical protein A2243_10420 [Omnitrophica WOR_2 bacterium RIFOXYA2_FULL_38_17]OGX54859.1 MAG: hypothetical protein A2267_01200 [Omnitrophica WOR_2 bacterium RIFOXYA12_FULL_38_10]OGX59552.1 MAG: hypothetical protein A2447_11880 [Omnitrophica WOR_2 bacterium RIFOXYC2_FULL_38_12]OGX59943.1 MAG: hypothetical protein A2306_04415 [Omnitrophica WOR_2 bacterium RIFOXYB2_FULL_38_16]
MLIVGYSIFWVELFLFDTSRGSTSFLSWMLFLASCLIVLIENRVCLLRVLSNLYDFIKKESLFERLFLVFGTLLCAFIIFVAIKASLLPPHLPQEYDSLNYHITLPRQHLIVNSFSHLSWSTADLFLSPIDYSLAPYLLATKLPNKLPQIFFSIGLLFILISILGHYKERNYFGKFLIVFSVLGSHFICIQMGVAMIDMIICYLLFAFIDSLLNGKHVFAVVEFAFCFWSKPQVPILISALLFISIIFVFFIKKAGFKIYFISESCKNLEKCDLKKYAAFFLMLSLVIGGPFIAKSIKYTGTPLFPFFVGKINLNPTINVKSDYMSKILNVSNQLLGVKDQYGKGKGISAFIKHLWLISVPEKDVNNSYDYPVGLPYLLCAGVFILLFYESIKKKKIDLMMMFIVIYWALWWIGSNQTRFLYVPIIGMYIIVILNKRFVTRVFSIGILISLMIASLSIFRAHKRDFGREKIEVIRSKDKMLIEMSGTVNHNEITILDFEDAAFADFPIKATNYKSSMFVLNTEKIIK